MSVKKLWARQNYDDAVEKCDGFFFSRLTKRKEQSRVEPYLIFYVDCILVIFISNASN